MELYSAIRGNESAAFVHRLVTSALKLGRVEAYGRVARLSNPSNDVLRYQFTCSAGVLPFVGPNRLSQICFEEIGEDENVSSYLQTLSGRVIALDPNLHRPGISIVIRNRNLFVFYEKPRELVSPERERELFNEMRCAVENTKPYTI